jgi:bacteriorhodopsin
MMQVFLIQFLAAALGGLSCALADLTSQKGRIGWRLYSVWVAASISVICLPVLAWTSSIFLGSGRFGQLVAGLLVVTIFLWVYFRLPKTHAVGDAGMRLPQQPSSGRAPPASNFHG